jgi:hypothetical protein
MFPNRINHANDDDLHNTYTEVDGLLSPWRAGLATARVPFESRDQVPSRDAVNDLPTLR